MRRPSRRGAACWEPISGAAAVTRPASAVMSLRASSRSLRSSAFSSAARPHLTAAALIMWMAAELMISMAGTSAMSRSCSLTASTCSSVSSVWPCTGVSSSAVKRKFVFSVLIVLESHISFVSVNASLRVGASVDFLGDSPQFLWCFASNSLRLSGILRYGCRQFASGACLPPG